MMSHLIVLTCVALVALSARPLPSLAGGAGAPRLASDALRYSFGRAANTGDVCHAFVLTNEGDAPLHISKVRQKAFIEVDEKGTTAAAVTSVEVGVTSAPPMLVADRPFLFAIRERLSGTILFVGMVHDPTAN